MSSIALFAFFALVKLAAVAAAWECGRAAGILAEQGRIRLAVYSGLLCLTGVIVALA